MRLGRKLAVGVVEVAGEAGPGTGRERAVDTGVARTAPAVEDGSAGDGAALERPQRHEELAGRGGR
ncbi:MAG: hypothetical protein ACRDT0_03970 [Pseudonocardiaceae bacterium]